jgi:hypothetical protein
VPGIAAIENDSHLLHGCLECRLTAIVVLRIQELIEETVKDRSGIVEEQSLRSSNKLTSSIVRQDDQITSNSRHRSWVAEIEEQFVAIKQNKLTASNNQVK